MSVPTKFIDFIKISRFTLPISAVLVLASIYFIFFKGFSLGVDFAGGASIQLQYTQAAPISKIRNLLNTSTQFKNSQVSEFGSKEEIIIKMPYDAEVASASAVEELKSILKPSGEFEIRKFDIVGPKVGDELKTKGIMALSLAMLAILIYVSFRYEWRFALASVIALFHDVLISAASVIVFKIDLNLEVIAALLTLMGYSINDTIIIFDRIRETLLTDSKDDFKTIINKAITVTLNRSIFTSLTVFFVVFTLYIFGGENIIGFSLPMLVGVIVGTFSSVFIAPEIIIFFGFKSEIFRMKENEKAKKKEEREKMRSLYQNGRV